MRALMFIWTLLITLAMACPALSEQSANNTSSAAQAAGNQTFTVLVGHSDPAANAELEAFFPATIRIHAGDTVSWKQDAMEIHIVTFSIDKMPDFLVPVPGAPAGAMMVNPQVAFPILPEGGIYNGTGFANSGVMGPDPDMPKSFNLTFSRAGTYNYTCVIHSKVMNGIVIVVENSSTKVPMPVDVQAQGIREMENLSAKIPALRAAAANLTMAPVNNTNGTRTYYVTTGYSQGQIDLMGFFPSMLEVHPGDTVVWVEPQEDMAPHTVTFLNGAYEPETFVYQNTTQGERLMLINPVVAAPENATMPLTNQGIYNSGLIVPDAPGSHSFSMKVGNFTGAVQYICMLHDDSKMMGTLMVIPGSKKIS